MHFRKERYLFPILLGAVLLIAAAFTLLQPQPASAQCGSQASSCKSCHEVRAEDPVNADGTGWHQSHAFGDFCYICHAGNNQSTVKEEAHAGMVPPLSDTKAACQQCHPDDLDARVQVYASVLGVTPGEGAPPSGGGDGDAPAPAEQAPAPAPAAAAPAPAEMVVDSTASGEVVDYNKIYAGESETNWGNVILVVMIVLMGLGGGAFVYFNERKLRGLPLKAAASSAGQPAPALPKIEGVPPEVVALLPGIAQLTPVGRHALRRLLENPQEASELLHSLSRLDPELVKRIRSLDRESRALLLALGGD